MTINVYFFSFVDDFSRNTWTYLLSLKSDVVYVTRHFLIIVNNQFGCFVKKKRYDIGGEFLNENCANIFQDNGIIHETTCLYAPK